MIVPEAVQGSPESLVQQLHVIIVGAGVVGHAEGIALRERGHYVVFSDVDEAVLDQRRTEGFQTTPMSGLVLAGMDVVLVSVSTPNSAGEIDLRNLEAAVATIGDALGRASSSEPGRYRVVVVRSTVPPGTTDDVVIPLLEAEAGLQAGLDFGVCVSPEYLRQRMAVSDSIAPRLVVIGQLDERSGDVAERLNAGFGCPIYRVPIREAEFHKYAHNLCNASKISFFNELRRAAIAVGVDTERVFALVAQSAEAMWNAEYGTLDMGPYGGACLPKDLEAFLAWAARQGLDLPILSAVRQSNHPAQAR
ncbi:MAG: UDP-glucose/GDP-mannose dehydrogenase family protein [Actinomycetota bacterium]